MANELFYKTEYCLKYKDETVFKFIPYSQTLHMINPSLVPISLHSTPVSYDMIRKFCADRILMFNRAYCKELLAACGIYDHNDVSICILCKGLSFRDNYWICKSKSRLTWSEVNLYENENALHISRVALTGDMTEVENNINLENLLTGALTAKGTRAKCYIRENGNLYLYKAETYAEITSEIISYHIATALKLPSAKYWMDYMFDTECSVCQIFTSSETELIAGRDVISGYNTTVDCNSKYYEAFMCLDPINFMKMQIFDYVTLNTDRNRDNFGWLRQNGVLTGLYPIFDHDSCFKGKSVNGIYFPTNLTFAKTLELLKTKYGDLYRKMYRDIQEFKEEVKTDSIKKLFIQYKTIAEYESMLERVEAL